MNLHLHHVIDDIVGATGLAIIEAILSVERHLSRLADLRHPQIKSSKSVIKKALKGDYRSEAHKLARILWHLVTYKKPYDSSVFIEATEKYKQRYKKNLIRRIESMGYSVFENPTAPALALGVP